MLGRSVVLTVNLLVSQGLLLLVRGKILLLPVLTLIHGARSILVNVLKFD